MSLWYHKKKNKKKERQRYPDINTGDWHVQIEKADGHGFWTMQFDADPKLFRKIMKLAEKHGVVEKDFYPVKSREQHKYPHL